MRDVLRTRWAAVGAAVAVTLGAGGLSFTQAAELTDGGPVYVALEQPCRVIDTRPAPDNVGPSATPIAAGEPNALTVQMTGEHGKCTGALAIPPDAVGVAINLTAIDNTTRSHFRVYPADAALPLTSNLNFGLGQTPIANKIDVGLSTAPAGQIKIYNHAGTTDAAVDIFGYYIDHHHDDRYYTEPEVDAAVGAAVDAVPRPVAYGFVDTDGSLVSGVGVSASSWDAGQKWYVVDLDVSYHFMSYTTVVTTICKARVASTSSVGGNLLVFVMEDATTASQCGFGFVVYALP